MGQGKHLLRKIQVPPAAADPVPVRWLGPLRVARDGDRDEAGASLVEFALVLPVFMLLLLGMFTGGLAYSRKQSVASAAREGARYGATLPITGSLPTDAWLAKVGALTIASSDGELEPDRPGRLVCIAHVTSSGTARRWQAVGTAAPTLSNGTCLADDGRTGETRVQVVAQRTSELEALVFSRNLTLESHAVARFES
jgi:Flp pilus assembly protein TadG